MMFSKAPQYPKERNSFFVLSHLGWSMAFGLFQGFLWYRRFLLCCGSIFTHVFVGGKTIGNKAVIGGSWFAITIIDMEHITIISRILLTSKAGGWPWDFWSINKSISIQPELPSHHWLKVIPDFDPEFCWHLGIYFSFFQKCIWAHVIATQKSAMPGIIVSCLEMICFLSSWPFLFGLLSIWIVFGIVPGFGGSVLVSVDWHDVSLEMFLLSRIFCL